MQHSVGEECVIDQFPAMADMGRVSSQIRVALNIGQEVGAFDVLS